MLKRLVGVLASAVLLLAPACSTVPPTPTPDVAATVQATPLPTGVSLPSTAAPTAPPATPVPTAAEATRSPAALSNADVASRARGWLVRISRGRAIGSGIVLFADGTIITNQHVISDSGPLRVDLPDGRNVYGDVVGQDPNADLAVVRASADGLAQAVIGDPSRLRAGDPLIVVGYALDLPGAPTVTRGVFSGRREAPVNHINYVQTDAAMNPGVSGGPILNQYGEVVGINTWGIEQAFGQPVHGVSFAIPIDLAQSFAHSPSTVQAIAENPAAPPSRIQARITVSKRLGAAVRAGPSGDAPILANIGCGVVLESLGDQGGWFRVRWSTGEGWVGSARVISGTSLAQNTCAGAPVPPYTIGQLVVGNVQTGCLSVRSSPREAPRYWPATRPDAYSFWSTGQLRPTARTGSACAALRQA